MTGMSLESGGKLLPLPAGGEEVCAATSLAPARADSYLLSDGVGGARRGSPPCIGSRRFQQMAGVADCLYF